MQQQPTAQRNSFTRLIPFFILYTAGLLYLQFFMPRQQPPANEVQSALAQAQKLDQQGRTADPNVAKADRIKNLQEAAKKYEHVYNVGKQTPDGVKARFGQINVYDYLATNLEPSGTHWYDTAEQTLKDMEKSFHGRQGTVDVEVNGVKRTETGDLGKIASKRLNELRAARDERFAASIWYKILDFFVRLTGSVPAYSYALALALIVVILKGLTFPFQKRAYQSQRDMMRVQPLVKDMQEQMKGRPQEEINRRMFEIYKENNVSLTGGCLPTMVMMFALWPVFFMVREYEFQFTKATFLWIGSEYSKSVWWLADNLAQFDVPLFVVYQISMVASMLIQPKPADPQQAQQQKIMMLTMPIMFGVMMWMYQWSSAFMLYWLVLNIVSMYQSWLLMRQLGMNAPSAGSGGGGAGVVTTPPSTPLEPMKGVHKKSPNNGRNGKDAPVTPGRIRPRRSGRPR
jgi:YidC/Oxa1 family membrane protein insertase